MQERGAQLAAKKENALWFWKGHAYGARNRRKL